MKFWMLFPINRSLFETGAELVRVHPRWQILTDEVNQLNHIWLLEQLQHSGQAGQLVALPEVAQLNERCNRARGNYYERSQGANCIPKFKRHVLRRLDMCFSQLSL